MRNFCSLASAGMLAPLLRTFTGEVLIPIVRGVLERLAGPVAVQRVEVREELEEDGIARRHDLHAELRRAARTGELSDLEEVRVRPDVRVEDLPHALAGVADEDVATELPVDAVVSEL